MGNSRSHPIEEDIHRLKEAGKKNHDLKTSMVEERQQRPSPPGAGRIIYIVTGPPETTGASRTMFDPSGKFKQIDVQFPRVFANLDDALSYARGIIDTCCAAEDDVRIIKDRLLLEW